jgi:hypothetical protein
MTEDIAILQAIAKNANEKVVALQQQLETLLALMNEWTHVLPEKEEIQQAIEIAEVVLNNSKRVRTTLFGPFMSVGNPVNPIIEPITGYKVVFIEDGIVMSIVKFATREEAEEEKTRWENDN